MICDNGDEEELLPFCAGAHREYSRDRDPAMMITSEAAAELRCGSYKNASRPCMPYVQGSADAKTTQRKKVARWLKMRRRLC
ncbi:unnamed protein product [Linum trigynum]|uniref:Uncharacterized protein n=1 Tax=Linum trigynum TaxID=586398 RepID=A0AAV2FX89_9ROSI